MSRKPKPRNRAHRRKPPQTAAPMQAVEPEIVPCERPKAGPGQVFKREFIDNKSGHAKRFRNIATTPLTLAYWRGQLCSPGGEKYHAEDRLTAGETFARLWYTLHRTGLRDSTEQGVGGFDGLFWTEAKEQASARLALIGSRMERTNYLIVGEFCGNGASMADSLRFAGVSVHPNGTGYRIREALDDLVYATTGWTGEGGISAKPHGASTSVHSRPLHPFHA